MVGLQKQTVTGVDVILPDIRPTISVMQNA
jgi:hypothetical protein